MSKYNTKIVDLLGVYIYIIRETHIYELGTIRIWRRYQKWRQSIFYLNTILFSENSISLLAGISLECWLFTDSVCMYFTCKCFWHFDTYDRALIEHWQQWKCNFTTFFSKITKHITKQIVPCKPFIRNVWAWSNVSNKTLQRCWNKLSRKGNVESWK